MRRLIGTVMVIMTALGWACAQANPVSTKHVTARLMSEWSSVPPEGGTFTVALEQQIIPGWHTYWRNPGDSGEATRIDWTLPQGFEAGDIEWPAPNRIPFQTLVNFGFEGTVLFPVEITAPPGLTPGDTVELKAAVYWLVCEEICIPEDVTITLDLPVREGEPGIDTAAAARIEAARARLPRDAGWTAEFDGNKDHLRIAIAAPELVPAFEAGRIENVAFFPYEDGVILNAPEQSTTVSDGRVILTLEPGFLFTQSGMTPPEKVAGVLVLSEKSDDGKSLETAFRISANPGEVAAPARAEQSIPLWQALLYAALGGLILNLMPCVFPVIFLKALGFVSLAREAPQKVRLHGLLYTAGVLVSFAALGGLLFFLRSSDVAVGWGFQLQSPLVVGALIYLLFIVGLSLSGVFDVGTSLQGVGGSLAEMRGAGGAFFTGVLATIVAAPCTAPFMALALGTALTLPPETGLSIFLALGVGMALPYLVLSMAPSLASALPRPGPWMERLKQLLAFPLYFTAVWLLWVLAQQNVGANGIGLILIGLVLIAFAGWLLHMRTGLTNRGWQIFAVVFALASAIAAGGALSLIHGGSSRGASPAGTDIMSAEPRVPYEAFTQQRLDEALETDRPVFLNFTAAWCVTCHWNDANALSADGVVERFKKLNVIYLRGDWTNRDPQITRILERFGRAGVPLYVYYAPPVDGRRPAPVVLPPLLSESIVLRTLEDR